MESKDTLSLNTDKLHELAQKKPIQRNLLCAAFSIFDPIGVAAPITIRLRIIQQEIWRKGMKWDDQITRDLIPELFGLLDERNDLQTVEIPRHKFGYSYDNIALQVFSDAPYSTLAAVAHFVYSNSVTRQISSAFVVGKARVAPLKQHPITKFEMKAAVFGARHAKFIRKEQRIDISSTHMWTDSTAALQWLNDNKLLWLTEKKHPCESMETLPRTPKPSYN